MRLSLMGGGLLPAVCLLVTSVYAQDPSVNDRMNRHGLPPHSQADGYLAVTLAQLLVALGFTLQGIPAAEQQGTRVVPQLQSLAAVPDRASPHPKTPGEPPQYEETHH